MDLGLKIKTKTKSQKICSIREMYKFLATNYLSPPSVKDKTSIRIPLFQLYKKMTNQTKPKFIKMNRLQLKE